MFDVLKKWFYVVKSGCMWHKVVKSGFMSLNVVLWGKK